MCHLCQLAHGEEDQHITEWYYLGLPGEVPERLQGIVVRDKDSKGHATRILWVPRKHVKGGHETKEMRRVAMTLLIAVAQAVAVNKDLVVTGFDLDKLSYRSHWHAQAILDRPEETPVGLIQW